MGGSDPHDMTTTALSALDRTRATLDATIVLGPANPHRERVLLLTHRLAIRCIESPLHFPDVVRGCDIALVSFGVTAYELAACRVPALYLCLSDDHASSASVFEDARIGAVVGTYPNLSIDGIARSLEGAVDAFQDPDSWLHRVPAVVDGQGSVRVARRVAAALRGS